MSEPLILQKCSDSAEWNRLLALSPQATIFSDTRFLQSLGCRYTLWQVWERKKVVAMLAAIESEDGLDIIQYPFTPNQGFLFLHETHSLPRQRVLDEFRIAEFLIEQLCQRYRHISMSLSWQVTDVRPFLWHHYHEPELGQFTMQARYTALLPLHDISQDDIKMQARACRRQELKKAANYQIRFDANVGKFMELYALTFARQEIQLEAHTLDLVERICRSAVEGGYGWISSCTTPDGVATKNLFVHDHQRAYYLFAANDPALRNSGAATRLMFENIFKAQQMGLQELDFVGVNSPNRGDFKLSFNPELALYFDAHLRKPA
jgi:hypothetical protein